MPGGLFSGVAGLVTGGLLPASAGTTMLALDEFKERGNDVLGYVAGLGVLLGVLALIIIGGRMIHANFERG